MECRLQIGLGLGSLGAKGLGLGFRRSIPSTQWSGINQLDAWRGIEQLARRDGVVSISSACWRGGTVVENLGGGYNVAWLSGREDEVRDRVNDLRRVKERGRFPEGGGIL